MNFDILLRRCVQSTVMGGWELEVGVGDWGCEIQASQGIAA
jgi:hypothetical protein